MNFNIYLELDTLLDTRLGTLISLNPSLAARVVKDGYYKRKSNIFEFISSKVFNTFYKRRNKKVLIDPKPTSMIEIILTYIFDLRMFIRNNDPLKTITVYVNIHPFSFSSIEKEALLTSLKIKFPPTVFVEIVDIEEISIKWVKDNMISSIIKYDGLEWLDKKLETKELINSPLPQTILIVPDLKENNKGSDVEIEILMASSVKYIQLEFTDIGMWCAIDSIYKN